MSLCSLCIEHAMSVISVKERHWPEAVIGVITDPSILAGQDHDSDGVVLDRSKGGLDKEMSEQPEASR